MKNYSSLVLSVSFKELRNPNIQKNGEIFHGPGDIQKVDDPFHLLSYLQLSYRQIDFKCHITVTPKKDQFPQITSYVIVWCKIFYGENSEKFFLLLLFRDKNSNADLFISFSAACSERWWREEFLASPSSSKIRKKKIPIPIRAVPHIPYTWNSSGQNSREREGPNETRGIPTRMEDSSHRRNAHDSRSV